MGPASKRVYAGKGGAVIHGRLQRITPVVERVIYQRSGRPEKGTEVIQNLFFYCALIDQVVLLLECERRGWCLQTHPLGVHIAERGRVGASSGVNQVFKGTRGC